MFGSESDFDEQSGLLRSGKRYKRNLGSYTLGQNTEYTPLIPDDFDSEETPSIRNPPVTLQRRPLTPENPSQSESNPNPSSPIAGHSTLVSSPPPVIIPPPSAPQSNMAHVNDDIKLPIFKGIGSEDLEQFWFLCEAVQTAKNIMDRNTRRAQVVTSFRDRGLTWFMNFSNTQNYALADIKKVMIKELKKPKSESQCITELKEIQQK